MVTSCVQVAGNCSWAIGCNDYIAYRKPCSTAATPRAAHLVAKHEKPCLVDVVWVVGVRVGQLLTLPRRGGWEGRDSKAQGHRGSKRVRILAMETSNHSEMMVMLLGMAPSATPGHLDMHQLAPYLLVQRLQPHDVKLCILHRCATHPGW